MLRPYTWWPHSSQERWQYEVFIDVNRSLGGSYQYSHQEEIAFPGGIRREFICLASHYRDNKLVGICHNPHFDWRASGSTHSARPTQLLRPYNPGNVPEHTWRDLDGSADRINMLDELQKKRVMDEDCQELVRVDGEGVIDLAVEDATDFG